MNREEELKQLDNFIKKNGVTKLPRDERGPDFVVFSAWGKPRRKKKAKGTKKTKNSKKTS